MPDKGRPRLIIDEDFPLLKVLRAHFIGATAPFSIEDVADAVGVPFRSLYKQFEAERPLRADVMFSILAYVYRKHPVTAKRIVDLVFELYGMNFEARAKVPQRVRSIVEAIDGNLLDLFREDKRE